MYRGCASCTPVEIPLYTVRQGDRVGDERNSRAYCKGTPTYSEDAAHCHCSVNIYMAAIDSGRIFSGLIAMYYLFFIMSCSMAVLLVCISIHTVLLWVFSRTIYLQVQCV